MIKHVCTAWILIFWGKCRDLFTKTPLMIVDESVQEIEDRPIPDLPCDIIANILARLPAKCIFQLWNQTNNILYDLTTDPYFMRAHLDRATPTIVVQSLTQSVDNNIKLFVSDHDGAAKNVEATSVDLSSCNAYCEGNSIELWDSYDGFLLFRNKAGPAHFCIWNPTTKEQVTVTFPSSHFYVCGFYFHPRKKEYEVISAVRNYNKPPNDFQILNLKTKHRRSVGNRSYPPNEDTPPVFIKGTFYWMVDCLMYIMQNGVYPSLSDSILSFDVETEEFNTVEAVVPSNDSPLERKYPGYEFQLFELEGHLSLFDRSAFTEVFIWVFNCSTKHWDKKHSIVSPWRYCHEYRWRFFPFFNRIKYIKTKGEFVAYHSHDTDRPSTYSLLSSTWKVFEKKGFENDEITAATICTPSLLSLDAAHSVIPLVLENL